ncbi:MAG: hypothetical protein ACK554_10735, partial [Erythrobacteraceae bacterium]
VFGIVGSDEARLLRPLTRVLVARGMLAATELDDDLQTVIADNFSKFSQASAIDFYFDVGFPDFREPFGCNRIGVA